MVRHILTILLVISLAMNIFLAVSYHPANPDVAALNDRMTTLEQQNSLLQSRIEEYNISSQNDKAQLDFYRMRLKDTNPFSAPGADAIVGSAELQGPAVMAAVHYTRNGPFVYQQVSENGSMLDISAEVGTGEGRVLVQTKPLMGVVFQDAANTAVHVASQRTGTNLSGSDVIFSINAPAEVPEVDGPSAGALMTILAISAINHRPLNTTITLTGTIDQTGHIGAIGGVIPKAQAAKDAGKTMLLLPQENSQLTTYVERSVNYGGFTARQQVPQNIDAKEYIEKNIGITVNYVGTVADLERIMFT
jgi:hypothetical protein